MRFLKPIVAVALLTSFAFGCDCCITTTTTTVADNDCCCTTTTTTTTNCPTETVSNDCCETAKKECPEETTTCAKEETTNACPKKRVVDEEFDTPVNNIWSTIPCFGGTTKCCGDLEFCGC